MERLNVGNIDQRGGERECSTLLSRKIRRAETFQGKTGKNRPRKASQQVSSDLI